MLSSNGDSAADFVSLDPPPPRSSATPPISFNTKQATPPLTLNGEMQRERPSTNGLPAPKALATPSTGPLGVASSSTATPEVWVDLPFRTLCKICLATPLLGLVACLCVAVIFQFAHIQETACKVSHMGYGIF